MHNQESVIENETHKLLWNFEIQTDHLLLAIRPELIIINKKRRELEELWTLLSLLTREIEKKDNYLDIARELKKPWNIKVMIIAIVIGSLGLEDGEVGGRVETIQTTALL